MKNAIFRNVEILQGGGLCHPSCKAVFSSLLLALSLSSCGDDDLPSPEGVKSSSGEAVVVTEAQQHGMSITVNPEWDGEYYQEF